MDKIIKLEGRLSYKSYTIRKIDYGSLFLAISTLFTVFFMVFIVSSLVLRANFNLLQGDTAIYKALKITGKSILISNTIVLLLGLPFTFYLSINKGTIYKIVEVFSQLPIVIPPAIIGMAMFTSFGKHGSINLLLSNSNFSFKFYSIVLVQVFMGLPFFIQMVKSGFDKVSKEVVEAAHIDGVTLKDLLLKIYIPLTSKNIVCGLIISILRGVGEFGATMMFAGNISGKTQTLTTLIYTYSQTDTDKAVALAAANIIFFIFPLFLFKLKSEK